MPWEVVAMSEIRRDFVDAVLVAGDPMARACRRFGISRKTGYKWIFRFQQNPQQPLQDQSRRPRRSPRQTPAKVQQRLVEAHQTWGWGARKVRQIVKNQGLQVPSVNTVQTILARAGCTRSAPAAPATTQRFERAEPNDLWQMDFKGPLEIARIRMHPLTLQDDHSRFLLAISLCENHTHALVWNKLWDCFGEYGLPRQILCDNEFSTGRQAPRTLTWLEANMLRLGIQPVHGRPYHPQTQGKVENVHASYERELLPRANRDSRELFEADLQRYRRDFNLLRPHEALGLAVPASRWRPSSRPRPSKLPPLEYPNGSQLRKVSTIGDIRWRACRIKAGHGLAGQYVRVEETDQGVAVYYADYRVRLIPQHSMIKGPML
jgi:transposase InsO family protein